MLPWRMNGSQSSIRSDDRKLAGKDICNQRQVAHIYLWYIYLAIYVYVSIFALCCPSPGYDERTCKGRDHEYRERRLNNTMLVDSKGRSLGIRVWGKKASLKKGERREKMAIKPYIPR
jgi:hypothetical protein